MEDTLSFARGRPVTRNAELVERAAELARLAQRPPMRPAEARTFLGISLFRTNTGACSRVCNCKHSVAD
jgi:uncharacterized protein (DUF849 family)